MGAFAEALRANRGSSRGPITLKGGDKLLVKLARLTSAEAKKVIRKALREGARPVQQKAKASVPVNTGALRKSVKIRAGKRTRKQEVSIWVGTGDQDNLFTGKTFYGGMIEYGTNKMAAQPFMRPAWDTTKIRTQRIIKVRMGRGLTILAKKK